MAYPRIGRGMRGTWRSRSTCGPPSTLRELDPVAVDDGADLQAAAERLDVPAESRDPMVFAPFHLRELRLGDLDPLRHLSLGEPDRLAQRAKIHFQQLALDLAVDPAQLLGGDFLGSDLGQLLGCHGVCSWWPLSHSMPQGHHSV